MRKEDIESEEYFDSANIAESYSGIVLPLTCSFAKMVYERVYKDLLRMSGVSKKLLERHSKIFENLLGFFYGRMYYNMNNWYAMAEFVPGYRRNKENFELMITSNVKESVPISIKPSMIFVALYPFIVGIKVLMYGLTSRQFKVNVAKHLRELRALDFDLLDYQECITLLERINKDLLHRWYITVENDFFVMTYLGLLKKLLGEDQLQKAIVFSSKATEQVGALTSLSIAMATIKPVWDAIESNDVERFAQEMKKHKELEEALGNYLHTFGGRFANELKLESVGVDEDLTRLFTVLKNYRFYKAKPPAPIKTNSLPFFKGLLVKLILSEFKKYASRREEFRLLRSNTFAMARHLFRRMGTILVEKGRILEVDNVFYLRLEELLTPDALLNKEFSNIIQERKQEYGSYGVVTPPSHFATKNGHLPPVTNAIVPQKSIEGRPASPGIVRGKVRIFKEFSMPQDIDFDILVTSHTDPGWTSLIALSKGLIIEHGGVLSHASIVARELGVPAVIGATNAMGILKNNQTVEINGSKGTVKVL